MSSRRPSLDARASVVGFDRDAQSHAAGAQATAAPGRQVAGLLSRQLSNQAAAQRPSENALTQPLVSALSPAEGSQQHAVRPAATWPALRDVGLQASPVVWAVGASNLSL